MSDHDDITPADDRIEDPAHVSEELASDAAEVAESVGAAADTGPPAGEEPLELTPEQLDALIAERDEFLDAYRRTAADFDNFRKQSQKRIADEVARAQGGFVERLLPVLDAIEAARAHAGEEESAGVESLAKALFGFLEKEGLERVSPEGEHFDPNVAEAVMHEPGDGEPTVVEVLRTGYLWQGRVIRAAMVKVAG